MSGGRAIHPVSKEALYHLCTGDQKWKAAVYLRMKYAHYKKAKFTLCHIFTCIPDMLASFLYNRGKRRFDTDFNNQQFHGFLQSVSSFHSLNRSVCLHPSLRASVMLTKWLRWQKTVSGGHKDGIRLIPPLPARLFFSNKSFSVEKLSETSSFQL